MRALDLGTVLGWSAAGVELSLDPDTVEFREKAGILRIPRSFGGYEFALEAAVIGFWQSEEEPIVHMLMATFSFVEPDPPDVKVSKEQARQLFSSEILETPFAREEGGGRDVSLVDGTIQVVKEKALYIFANTFLMDGKYDPHAPAAPRRLAYVCTATCKAGKKTFEIYGFVDAETNKLIGGAVDSLIIPR